MQSTFFFLFCFLVRERAERGDKKGRRGEERRRDRVFLFFILFFLVYFFGQFQLDFSISFFLSHPKLSHQLNHCIIGGGKGCGIINALLNKY